jgi:hypothetical protein
MFGKKNKPIDLQEDKARKDAELAALEASLDFLKRPQVQETDDTESGDGEKQSEIVTAADRARAMKFGRRMDYKTAVVKRGENNQEEVEKTSEDDNDKTAEEIKPDESAQQIIEAESSEMPAETVEENTIAVTAEAEEPVPAKSNEDETQAAKDEKPAAEESKGIVIAEAPVPDTGETEEPQLIENPLPTPKKHVPKEMDFDIEPDPDHMHFDVVDLKGKDYFDI